MYADWVSFLGLENFLFFGIANVVEFVLWVICRNGVRAFLHVALQEMEDGPVIRARKARQDRVGGGSCEDVGGAASERLVDTSGATCGYDARDQDGCCDDTPPKSPGRAHDLWRKVKKQYELVEYHVLPEYLRDNEFILRHYRSDWPMKETLLSIFTIHNETLNIWT